MMDASDVIRLVWTQTWQLSLLIMALAVAVRLTSRNRPYLAHALWLVVLLKCLTPPLWSSPGGVFCWLESRVAATAQVQSPSTSNDSIPAAEPNRGDLPAAPPAVAVWLADRREQGDRSGTATAAFSAPSTQKRGGVEVWLLLTWLAGTSLALAISWLRWWRCWRQLHRHRLPHDSAYDAALAGLARRVGLRRPVRLMVTSSRFGPAVIGLLRPVIALPQIIVQGKSAEDLEPILAHELIHVRRGDLWVGLMQALSIGLWWFHPLVWLANRWISREAERCCDEAVLATLGCPPGRYARCLLDVLERKQMLRPVPAFPGVRPIEVTSRRLERIMQLGQGCRQRMPWWCWIVMLGVASATLPGAAWVAGDEQPADAAPPLYFAQPVVPQPVPPSLPPTKAVSAAPLGPLVTNHYELADVLDRAREELGDPSNEARSHIAQELAAAGGSEWAKLGVDIDSDANGRPQIKDDQRGPERPALRWMGTTAVVRHDVQGHQRIADRIAELRRYGFARLQVEIQFITARSEVVEKAVSLWRISPVEISEANDVAAASAKLDPWDPWAAGAEQRLGNRSISSIEQQCPFQYQVVDGEQFRRIKTVLEKDRKTNILSAPKINTFNGRSAMVQSGCQRPFVVGLRRGEPQIQIITEGITLRLKPELLAVGPVSQQDREVAAVAHMAEVPHARLAVQFVHSEILDVTTRTINVAGRREPVTLQVPRVQSSSVESTLVAALDQTLIIGGLHAQGDDETQALLVAMTVRRIESDSTPQVSDAGPDGETGGSVGANSPAGESPAKPSDNQPRSNPPAAEEDSVLVRVYAVGDLVFPLPGAAVVRWNGDDPTGGTQQTEESLAPASYAIPQPDFTALIDLIQSSISPESWELAGGPGAIEPFPTNLSLVVRQTAEVHEAIAELLQGLQRLQEVQVAVETRVLGLSDADFRAIGSDKDGELANRGYRVLCDEEMRSLMQSVQDRAQNAVVFAPKIVLFSGQAVTLQLGTPESPYTLLLRPLSSGDLESVQLRFAVSTADLPELREDHSPLRIASGHTLFIDAQDQLRPESFGLGNEIGTPILSKLPYPNRLFKSRPELKTSRVAVLVTPRIIIQQAVQAVPK